MRILSYLAVALGCFLGANCRHYLEKYLEHFTSNNLAILTINTLGCFIIGLITAYILLHILHPHLISFLVTGFCGGFTTFSSMVYYLVKPLNNGDLTTVILYLCLNIIYGALAVYLGLILILPKTTSYKEI